jgi:hypothetical protein
VGVVAGCICLKGSRATDMWAPAHFEFVHYFQSFKFKTKALPKSKILQTSPDDIIEHKEQLSFWTNFKIFIDFES